MSDISVVLVDDDPMISRLYGAAVARIGFQSATANSAEEAIECPGWGALILLLK